MMGVNKAVIMYGATCWITPHALANHSPIVEKIGWSQSQNARKASPIFDKIWCPTSVFVKKSVMPATTAAIAVTIRPIGFVSKIAANSAGKVRSPVKMIRPTFMIPPKALRNPINPLIAGPNFGPNDAIMSPPALNALNPRVIGAMTLAHVINPPAAAAANPGCLAIWSVSISTAGTTTVEISGARAFNRSTIAGRLPTAIEPMAVTMEGRIGAMALRSWATELPSCSTAGHAWTAKLPIDVNEFITELKSMFEIASNIFGITSSAKWSKIGAILSESCPAKSPIFGVILSNPSDSALKMGIMPS